MTQLTETSWEGRQRRCRRNLQWQAVPHLAASSRKCSAANSEAVNRRLDEAVAAGRAKSSATWKVGNISERAKVRRCTVVEHLVHQDGNFAPDVRKCSAGSVVRTSVFAGRLSLIYAW